MSVGIDVVIAIVKGIISWVESNKKCQEKIEGVITYIKAINHALTSFKPKGKPSTAIEEILTVTYQCMRDIKALLDQVKQVCTGWDVRCAMCDALHRHIPILLSPLISPDAPLLLMTAG